MGSLEDLQYCKWVWLNW